MSLKSIRKNYMLNVIYQILLLITPLITSPYLARVLGVNGIGNISFAESVVSYFAMFAMMGVATYGQREISYVQDNIERRSEVFWNTKILGFCVSSVAILIYILFLSFQKNMFILYLTYTLNLFSVFFDITWFFQGMEDFKIIVTRNSICRITQIIFIFIFVKDKYDLPIYTLGMGLFTFLGNISLWIYMPKYIKRVDFCKLKPFKNIKLVWSLFIPTVAISIYTVLDKIMIGIITCDSYENGCYELAIKISKMLLALVTALGTVMAPRVGFLFEKNDMDGIRHYVYRGYRFVWFLGVPLCFGVILTAENFIPWFLGEEYGQVVFLLQTLSFLILAIGISNVTGMQYLLPTKKQNIYTITVIIGACTNFVLNIILIPLFQSIGASIATIISESVIAIIQLIIIRKDIIPLYVLKEGTHYITAGVIMSLLLFPFVNKISPSLIHTIFIVICGMTIYFASLLIMKDDFFLQNIKGLMKKII